jgi:drug/metabolite transporter (DMT)-like permease
MPLSAVLLALTTLLLWSFLAFLGSGLSRLSPLLVVGLALSIGSLVSLPRIRQWKVPARVFLVGVGGLFGYHLLYFSAFRFAPPVEANLINYLWPLLIVLMAPIFLAGFQLQPHHVAGAMLGLAGTFLIMTSGRLGLDWDHLPGYLLAAGAALTWATYSLLTRRLPPFPTAAVGGFCLASGLISLALYALAQASAGKSLFPGLSAGEIFSLIVIGLGPMGIAFFTWDAALKRGDPRIIGSLSYLTPLSSTLILVLIGGKILTWITAGAMALIVSGAVIGSLDLLRRKV